VPRFGLYSHARVEKLFDRAESGRDEAQALKTDPLGFKSVKGDKPPTVLGVSHAAIYTHIGAAGMLRQMRRGLCHGARKNRRCIDIHGPLPIVSSMCPAAIGHRNGRGTDQTAHFEDPLAPAWSEGWEPPLRAGHHPGKS